MGSSYATNEAGVVTAYANYEGTATGFGTVFGTMSFPLPVGGATTGTFKWTGQGFPPDSPWVSGPGEGTWQQIAGENSWNIVIPTIENSDGSLIRSEEKLDLAARTLSGQMFDASGVS
jgi:hypothetical protein